MIFKYLNILKNIHSSQWSSFSRLIIKSDKSNWSLSWDAKELIKICNQLNIEIVSDKYENTAKNQTIFYTSKYEVLLNWEKTSCRIAFPYFHGRPQSTDEFSRMIKSINVHHNDITRIQVSHSEMHEIILETGIDSEKVFQIPIGINLDYFSLTSPDLRLQARSKLGIPHSAIVIGSFQKDGNGWGEGLEPKHIKGPDVFLRSIEILKSQVPELFILLTGPARGFVKNGLEKLGIPYRHKFLNNYADIGQYFNALDLYIVASREEGGPKAVLESMASGIPLVTTRVGQAMDLVKQGINGWMVEPEDAEGLAHWAKYVLENSSIISDTLKSGRQTAIENSYSAQISLWKEFMTGFVCF